MLSYTHTPLLAAVCPWSARAAAAAAVTPKMSSAPGRWRCITQLDLNFIRAQIFKLRTNDRPLPNNPGVSRTMGSEIFPSNPRSNGCMWQLPPRCWYANKADWQRLNPDIPRKQQYPGPGREADGHMLRRPISGNMNSDTQHQTPISPTFRTATPPVLCVSSSKQQNS
uniref:Putative secreted protein n=1 Tax=Anopheles marajoara TaxID=58244 RepID=A0A2M4C670_9DIPT